MLEQNQRHRIGQEGTIGMVAQSRQARVISDTLTGIDFIDKSNLLETRSQATFPLKSEAELIGVMDIQATDVNAFSEDDMSMLTMLADQVSVAIQTALLFEQSQRALHEAEIVSGLTTELTWRGYAETIDTKGYRYDGITSEPLKGQSTPASENNPASIPVRLRGQVIGRLNLRASDSSRQWTEDELAMIEATASRVALAIEGARLLGEAKNRAERETFLSEIGTKLGSSFQLDSILRDTVEELGKTFKDSTVSFQLVDPTSTTPAGLRSTRNASERKNKTE
jgi:signal transduction protein with GAF and PtsI domain